MTTRAIIEIEVDTDDVERVKKLMREVDLDIIRHTTDIPMVRVAHFQIVEDEIPAEDQWCSWDETLTQAVSKQYPEEG
jgi:hypothetical protein|tara:strand:- start:50 stop:283 length:234 start_codon:yes stop_codon:yes gene_type:complete